MAQLNLLSCSKSKTFRKATGRYNLYKAEIDELIRQICEDPSIGRPFNVIGYKNVMHAKSKKLGSNFAVYYVICDDAREQPSRGKCPWCSEEDCDVVGPGGMMMLNFGRHKITDRIK